MNRYTQNAIKDRRYFAKRNTIIQNTLDNLLAPYDADAWQFEVTQETDDLQDISWLDPLGDDYASIRKSYAKLGMSKHEAHQATTQTIADRQDLLNEYKHGERWQIHLLVKVSLDNIELGIASLGGIDHSPYDNSDSQYIEELMIELKIEALREGIAQLDRLAKAAS